MAQQHPHVLLLDNAQPLLKAASLDIHNTFDHPSTKPSSLSCSELGLGNKELLTLALSSLELFLQINVTGPVLPDTLTQSLGNAFSKAWASSDSPSSSPLIPLRKACLRYLDVDGVAPYTHIPSLELFCLAKFVFDRILSDKAIDVVEVPGPDGSVCHSLAWAQLRVDVCHYKLLTQPSLGPGSNFAKSSQWSDIPTLAGKIMTGIDRVKTEVVGQEEWAEATCRWSQEDKTLFLVEAANYYILLGRGEKARETLKEATQMSGLEYALSGALGKRTRYQEKDISQLVVLAKSRDKAKDPESHGATGADDEEQVLKPDALKLNDDTLLEEIKFQAEPNGHTAVSHGIPAALADLAPDHQPQLSPLDQIILLTEATLKDAFSPADTLTSEEILPFAVRVLADPSTNWQIYTQALLVRSRIELHRSRTVERGVLQLQAVADQVIADTTDAADNTDNADTTDAADTNQTSSDSGIPSIAVTNTEEQTSSNTSATTKPTSFLPAPKSSESAPAQVRLRYIHALCSPPRWHLESELAHAWAGVGSLTSALEIFKRLRLWAEVALCFASSAAAEDEDGRGSGGEAKAKGIIRWRLFHRTDSAVLPEQGTDPDDEDVEDVELLREAMYQGPERSPAPPNAARLWCILGDLEDNPEHYLHAWEISSHRYARAQKSLAEYYLRKKEWDKARGAYKLATRVNRLDPDMWSRLGDISLRMGEFEDAANAFSRSISSATDTAGGEDARTWSNLGTALWSLYLELTAAKTTTPTASKPAEEEETITEGGIKVDPSKLIAQALHAFKKGASIAHSNWRIWDNVLTLSTRLSPPSIADTILALTHIISIRKTEDCLDAALLSALLNDVVLTKDKTPSAATDATAAVYEPPRGSPQRLVTRLFEEEIVPLITYRAELWSLVSKLRAWRRDYAGAIDATERAWRAAFSASSATSTSSSDTLLLPEKATEGGGGADHNDTEGSKSRDWLTSKEAWEDMVKRTDELVSVLENYGPQVDSAGLPSSRWKGKARSAVRSVMGRARESWEGSEGWMTLEGLMEGLKAGR